MDRIKHTERLTEFLAGITLLGFAFTAVSCYQSDLYEPAHTGDDPDHMEISLPAPALETEEILETIIETEPEETAAEPNGETYILFTSDVHCGIDAGFGYSGVYQMRQELESMGYNTILVDDGDAIQGDLVGSFDRGETIIQIMNAVGYDIAIPGNHEFDYGTERLIELSELAEFPYISCNFTYEDEPYFEPYTIITSGDYDIAFVGVTTPLIMNSSRPSYFQNEDGEYVYGFCQDPTGEALYEAVQSAVNSAREDGADLVYVMGHLGNSAEFEPYTYADVISHTTGIDVFLDGHSHDTDQVVMLNADGQEVTRSAPGTRLNAVGYSHISADGVVLGTGIWTWDNNMSVSELLGTDNEISELVRTVNNDLNERLMVSIGESACDLVLTDPVATNLEGLPMEIHKVSEVNIGDFCADAVRAVSGAEIGFVQSGAIRNGLSAGDVTLGDVVRIIPYNNEIVVIEVSGQQILDALEWGVHDLPSPFGGFIQVSGLSYEVDMSVPSGCITDEHMACAGINGARRVSNVMVGDEPLDPDRYYTVAGNDYILINNGNGFTAFDGCTVVNPDVMTDYQALITYIEDNLNCQIPDEYSDPYGQGRIVINN